MKVLKWISVAVMIAGFLLVFWTAGASDIKAICIDVVLVRAFIALVMIVGGLIAAYFFEKKEFEQ